MASVCKFVALPSKCWKLKTDLYAFIVKDVKYEIVKLMYSGFVLETSFQFMGPLNFMPSSLTKCITAIEHTNVTRYRIRYVVSFEHTGYPGNTIYTAKQYPTGHTVSMDAIPHFQEALTEYLNIPRMEIIEGQKALALTTILMVLTVTAALVW